MDNSSISQSKTGRDMSQKPPQSQLQPGAQLEIVQRLVGSPSLMHSPGGNSNEPPQQDPSKVNIDSTSQVA